MQIALFAYGHDKAGLRTNETTLTHTDRFEYDPKRQLISAQRFDLAGNADATWSYRYAYDPIGNWTTAVDPDGVHRFTANALNQYTVVSNATGRPIRYDANGNLLADGNASFIFGEDDRLNVASNAIECATLGYDGFGRRVRIELEQAADVGQVIYDGVLAIATCSSDPYRSYSISRGLDVRLGRDRFGGIGSVLASGTAGNQAELFADERGNIRVEVSPTGSNMQDYTPYGAQTHRRSKSLVGFSSKEVMPQIGLVDFGRRYFISEWGRWLTRDPIEERGGLNLYAYVVNNPIGNNDPFGLACGNCGVKICVRALSGLPDWLPPGWIDHVLIRIGDFSSGYHEDDTVHVPDNSPEGKPEICYPADARQSGTLPNGTPCKCASCPAIQQCIMDFAASGRGGYEGFRGIGNNCGKWVLEALERCCMKERIPDHTYGPHVHYPWFR